MSNKKYIMSLDSGTTSCRTLIIDQKGEIVSVCQSEFTQFFPHSGWVEHDPIEIWTTQLGTMQSAKNQAEIHTSEIAAIGITNQRETIVMWDKETGLPVYNAIVWQDRRTSEYCDELIKQGHEKMISEKTGLIINPYFSGTKIRWILQNAEAAKKKLAQNKLLCGTIDTWLIWKLTEGKVHATDVTNASRTMLFNIHTLEWDQEILDLLEIPRSILPEVKSSSELYGYSEPRFLSQRSEHKVPISGVAGDQQAALFGQLCTDVGMVKNTYGTGCFALINTGTKAIQSKNRLLTTIAWRIKNQPTIYALEGSVFIAGSAIKWLRDSIKILYSASECDFYCDLAEQQEEQNVYIVPSFTGLGAPYWDSYSRGAIFGLERGTKREHIIKATVEAIAYQSYDLLKAMEKDLEQNIKVLRVNGGASNSNYLMQFQSSICNLDVERPISVETTALGAAFFAGLAVNYWNSLDEIKKIYKVEKTFKPCLNQAEINKKIKGWNEAVKRTLSWTKSIE
ncbi:glycerol kinase GlpK [Mycoplasma sp. E35C]|uniref:glycerol kinase GlpK n=1 Tax=Mycoplasma sp. E35C TaxID=2801918 RepID=UPI001CA3FE34|nr:glycerol kinase GlpK [Mycoplasma sp. E35C]QZX48864.1 glycerol kinase GlpK [Mycoplasma sp. E35C]